MLKEQEEVEWTLFNIGWLADYFVPKEYTYMKPVPLEFPVDANGWRANVRGTGDEEQSWTCARDVARAVVELCKADTWVSGLKRLLPICIKSYTETLWLLRDSNFLSTLCLPILQESHTYVAGEWNTFNAAIKTMELFYGNHSSQ